MAYPILKPNSSWFTPTVSTVNRGIITAINIVDSYTPSATPTDSWDASVAQDGSIMCYVEGTVLTIAGNGSGKIATGADASFLFSDYNGKDYYDVLTTINGTNILDTSNATTFFKMFNYCVALTRLDGSTWNTSNVTIMRVMFQRCDNITEILAAGWDVSNVTEIDYMFSKCAKLHTLDVSNWRTSSATTMKNMFMQCKALTSLDVTNWDVSACTNMYGTFDSCESLVNLDVSNWDVSNVTDFTFMFYKCPVPVLNVSNWDVGSGQIFNGMFEMCEGLTSLDVSNWDMSSATDLQFMFYKCTGLTGLNFANWNVSNVQNFDHLLAHATNLVNYDVSNWNITSACTNMYAMFHSTNITSINVSGWDVSNVIAFGQMFEGTSLTKIKGLETWDTSSGIDFAQMFKGCSQLKELNLSSFDTRKAKADGTQISTNKSKCNCTSEMFNGLTRLEKLVLGENFTLLGNGTATGTAIGTIPTPSATYIEGADGNWYTDIDMVYAPADIPNLTALIYYASPLLTAAATWEKYSKHYVHLAALHLYHNKLKNEIGEMTSINEITSADINSLFTK